MRDYENVVLDLRERASSYEQMFGEGKSSIVMKDAADAIEELVAERDQFRGQAKMVPKWISVEERLPDDCEHVLCRIEEECMYYDATGGEVFAMDSYLCEAHYRRGKHKGWYKAVSPDISSCTNNVTHWMPLPEPPKEDKP